MIKPTITGVGAGLPDYVLTNKELEGIVDTSDEWIIARTGIKERRILHKGKGISELGVLAVKNLIKKTGISPLEIDLIICCTVTPDYKFPATANIISDKVGAKNAWSFDINAACCGFLFGLETGSQFIKSGSHKKVIIVGCDKMSSIVDYKDRTTCVIFGDAAGAVLLEPSTDETGIQDSIMNTDGSGKDYLILKNGGSANPITKETAENRDCYLHQEGQKVFKHAVTKMADVTEAIMKKNNLNAGDIAYLVPHQANKRIIAATAKKMGITEDKVMVNINKYGNTTAATIPLCLWEWEKKLKKGDNLILAAFGGGFTWGASYIKWSY